MDSIAPPSPTAGDPTTAVGQELTIEGMHCAGCVQQVESALMALPGIVRANVDLASSSAQVFGSPLHPEILIQTIDRLGYRATAVAADRSLDQWRTELEEQQQRREQGWRWRALLGLGLWLPMAIFHMPMDFGWVQYSHQFHNWVMMGSALLATIAQILIGSAFYRSALEAARQGTTNMDTLIAIGSTVAWGFSLTVFLTEAWGFPTGQPMYWEAAAGLLALVSLGHWLEARTMSYASSALRDLLALQPDQVTRIEHPDDAQGETIPSASIRPKDLVLVRPGDRVAVDGTIVAGASALDESLVTGEPIPVEKSPGEKVVAGALNTTGRLVIQATSDGRRTTVARIAEIVRDAQASKARIARLADRVCAIFVPAVLTIAALTFAGWLWYGLTQTDSNHWAAWAQALIHATTVLVISCPCALGLATPTAVMVGVGAARKRGILVKSAGSLERAAKVKLVMMDKTGTLTIGKPTVSSLHPAGDQGFDSKSILTLAASLAHASQHPLSRAIVELAKNQGAGLQLAQQIRETAGRGISGTINGQSLELISWTAAEKEGFELPETLPASPNSRSVLIRNSQIIGILEFSDEIRPDAAAVIQELIDSGIPVQLVSGDRRGPAERVALGVGLTYQDVHAELSPLEKLALVQQSVASGRPVAMVGDGINDAAALAAAGSSGGVGMALGTGTNIAMESADVVIPAQRLAAIPETIRFSQATLRTIKQNLWMSFIYNVAAIPAAALGMLGMHGPLIAAAAMALSDLGVIGNSLRLKFRLEREK